MPEIRLATRGSDLALAQSRWVATQLEAAHPGLTVDIVEISTTGDIDRTSPVAALTEMGAFVRSVQYAVLDGRADLAVHSCKDLPVLGPEGLVQWYPQRAEPWDVLCGSTLADLPEGASVGTGSPRRTAQLLLLRPDLEVVPIRGNVGTRLSKIGTEVDAVVLAEAGLRRLGMAEAIAQRLGLDEMVPAPAQAALCVEAIEGSEAARLVDVIDDAGVRIEIEAERLLLAETGAGCRSALGGLAEATGDGLRMTAFVHDEAGPRRAVVEAHSAVALAGEMRSELRL